MDKRQILQLAQSDPRFSQTLQLIKQQVQDDITPENIDEYVKMLEFAMAHPDKWSMIREAAIKDGLADPEDLPERADPVFIGSILAALYGLQETMKPAQPIPAFARGGLAQAARKLQAHGRHGDTMLAHINPQEAAMLRANGGAGSINPNTGLPEFFSLKKLFKAIAPIALTFLAPGIGTAIGSALGASAAWAPVVGSAIMGAGSAALSGGNIAQGALLGGLTGGLGGAVGGSINDAMNLGLSQSSQAMLGSALAGGVGGKITGNGFLNGAIQGAVGQMSNSALGNIAGSGAFGDGLRAAGSQFGNMMAAGYDPKQSAMAAGLTGVATGAVNAFTKPSDAVLNNLEASKNASGNNTSTNPADAAKATKTPGSFDNLGKLLPLASLISAGQEQAPIKQAVSQLSPQQQEYLNRPSVSFDWSRIQKDASESGMDLGSFMAQNWNTIASGQYNIETPKFAKGGALSRIAYMAQGSGTGRDDTIDAKLSDGEYVIDAETVALLGDGSTKAGAKKLEEMRQAIRAHKGAALAKGKFSPDAKSPLQYLKGAK